MGDEAANRLHNLKKAEMAEGTEQLVQGKGSLPTCPHTPAAPEEMAQGPLPCLQWMLRQTCPKRRSSGDRAASAVPVAPYR